MKDVLLSGDTIGFPKRTLPKTSLASKNIYVTKLFKAFV